jgi:hypothetical protein
MEDDTHMSADNIIPFPRTWTPDPKPARKCSGWRLELRQGPPSGYPDECVICNDVRDDEAPFLVALRRTAQPLTPDSLFPVCQYCARGLSRRSILRRAREGLIATMWCRDADGDDAA